MTKILIEIESDCKQYSGTTTEEAYKLLRFFSDENIEVV